MKICPLCRHKNREGYMFCEDCGEELTQVISVPDNWHTSQLKPAIALRVEGDQESIDLQLDIKNTLGRFDPERGQQPDIDLNRFEAFEKGVSVIHAEILYDLDGVKIMDVGSKNGTFVNGRRLVPMQFHLLRDGDEVRLSRLITYVHLSNI